MIYLYISLWCDLISYTYTGQLYVIIYLNVPIHTSCSPILMGCFFLCHVAAVAERQVVADGLTRRCHCHCLGHWMWEMDSFALQHPHDQGHKQKSKYIYTYTYIYICGIYTIYIWYLIYSLIYIYMYTHVRLRVHIHTQYRIFLIYINMLKIHRWTGGWVFSRIQELFSFQQDVAATKKNPMCWLRRAEAEQNMTGNL